MIAFFKNPLYTYCICVYVCVYKVFVSKNKWLQEKAQSIQDALAQGRPSVV